MICRTAATRRSLIALLTERYRGCLGLEITTLAGMIQAIRSAKDIDAPTSEGPLPDGHPWCASLQDRPQLRAVLRQHTTNMQLLKSLGGEHVAHPPSDPICQLMDAGWFDADDIAAAVSLQGNLNNHADLVYLCGFDPEQKFTHCGQVDNVVRRILSGIPLDRWTSLADDSQWNQPRVPSPPPQRFDVSDVHAEARVAVEHVLKNRESAPRVLILVQHPDTEQRVRSALLRNGVTSSSARSTLLNSHGFTALARSFVPVFASHGLCAVNRSQLEMWLTSPLLGRGTPTDGRTAPVTCTSEISDRQVHEVLNAARRSAATVREWREAADTTSKLQGNQYENYTSDSKNDRNVAQDRAEAASVLAERIACVAKHAATGTLAAMASMFRELGAHIKDHATANIVRALSEIGAAASFTAIDRCVAGEADAAILPHAVHVLRYEDYDLQTSDLLVCLDLHSKGIAAPPLDDPIIESESIRTALGLATPQQIVAERQSLLYQATARASHVVYVVTSHGADGKRVVSPQNLCGTAKSHEIKNHGLDVQLPECAPWMQERTLVTSECTRFDAQIDAEWIRSGKVSMMANEPTLPDPRHSSLAAWLSHEDRPERVRPYLGAIGKQPTPADESTPGIPNGFTFSPSRVESFTGCLYRGWASQILKIDEREIRGEDLGSDELGTAAHAAIAKALSHTIDGKHMAFVLAVGTEAEGQSERAHFADNAAQAFPTALVQAAQRESPGSAVDSMPGFEEIAQRWQQHWPQFANTRIRTHEEAERARAKAMCKAVGVTNADHRKVIGYELLPAQTTGAAATRIGQSIVSAVIDVEQPLAIPVSVTEEFRLLTHRKLQELKPVKSDPALLDQALDQLESAAERLGAVQLLLQYAKMHWIPHLSPKGDRHVIAIEASIGSGAGVLINISSAGRIRLRGTADAVVKCADGSLEIIDFKTGSAVLRAEDAFETLLKPQLPLYALAAESGHIDGVPPDSVVRRLIIDSVKQVDGAYESIINLSSDNALLSLTQFTEHLGAVLEPATQHGDFRLQPHPRACPLMVSRGAYCDFKHVCRHRGRPRLIEADMEGQDIQ